MCKMESKFFRKAFTDAFNLFQSIYLQLQPLPKRPLLAVLNYLLFPKYARLFDASIFLQTWYLNSKVKMFLSVSSAK